MGALNLAGSGLASSTARASPSSQSAFVALPKTFRAATKTAVPMHCHRSITMGSTLKTKEQVAEYRSWTDEELDQKVADCKMELFFLRMQLAARQEIKTHRFDALRKTVARLLTVKREREIAEGIKPRESRKRSKALEHARGGWWKVANIPEEFKYLTTPGEGDSVVEI
ncbi:chloroplast ribosomal protein L29 [Klebsormidium nitens]|uniref:Large ribosomal subunit protein uL29c n=1 Tax=Klebsormidium nitens TaxID=105231 RepID=A0A1Y1I4L6_KLENI|nr:chloroplast ribosomal protein L29 [Klebsormidium nitens]|eukprot:GAQ83058.1 chloroplast ribosomal protein L29 [Klebsormidium nitens]